MLFCFSCIYVTKTTSCANIFMFLLHSLRALFGTDGTQNATHGSDSPQSAAREIKFFFPQLVLEPLQEADAAKNYIAEKLQPALAKALTALAREKPSAEKFEAITFLANYLLTNNPNKPKIITPDEWDPSMEEEDDEAEFAHAQLKMYEERAAAEEQARAEAAAKAAAEKAAAEAAAAEAAAAEAAAAKAAADKAEADKAAAEAAAAQAAAERAAAAEAAAAAAAEKAAAAAPPRSL